MNRLGIEKTRITGVCPRFFEYVERRMPISMGIKTCTKCQDEKSYEAFDTARKGRGGRAAYCKECRRFEAITKKYGVTKEQYFEMLAAQNGGCAVCGHNGSKYKLCVDHCHDTGEVRGILCDQCNKAEGLLDGDTGRIRNLLKYLEDSR
jgi:hypothetical protein